MNKQQPYQTGVVLLIGLLIIMVCAGIVKEQQTKEVMDEILHKTSTTQSCDCQGKLEAIQKDTSEIKTYYIALKANTKTNNITTSQECELPDISTNVKLFTDYRYYNLWYTPHYRLQQRAWTDEQGLRRFNDDYIVALGSFYSVNIGDRFEVTLDTGRTFTVILGDGKADIDCDSRNMYTPCLDYDGEESANMLEFIIDDDVLDKEIYDYGSLDRLEGFEGDVVKMVYLGRDDSADWNTYETLR